MAIERFEDMTAWQKGRELARLVRELSDVGPFARDFALRDQMRRAADSITSNIVEGFERDGNTEFRQFLSVAKGSAGEVRSQSYLALDACYISEAQFTDLRDRAEEIGRILNGLIRSLATSDFRGRKEWQPSGQ